MRGYCNKSIMAGIKSVVMEVEQFILLRHGLLLPGTLTQQSAEQWTEIKMKMSHLKILSIKTDPTTCCGPVHCIIIRE